MKFLQEKADRNRYSARILYMRKKTVLLRGDYSYIDALRINGRWTIDVLPLCCYASRTFAVILDSPSVDDLMDEIDRASVSGLMPRIITVTDNYADIVLRAFCPSAVSVRKEDGADGVIAALCGKKRSPIEFSERELDLIRRMRNGPSNKELSLSMSVSERTVRRIKEGIFRKTGFVSGEQLAVFSVYIDQYSQLLTYLG